MEGREDNIRGPGDEEEKEDQEPEVDQTETYEERVEEGITGVMDPVEEED